MPKYVFIDIETTNTGVDFSVEKAEIIEIGMFEPQENREFQRFVGRRGELAEFTKRLTGITERDLLNGEFDIARLGEEMREFIGDPSDTVLVGHNVEAFDMKILARYFPFFKRYSYLDTLQAFLLLYPMKRSYKVQDLYVDFFEHPEYHESHRALQDCKDEAKLFEYALGGKSALLERYRSAGRDFESFECLVSSSKIDMTHLFSESQGMNQLGNYLVSLLGEAGVKPLRKGEFFNRYLKRYQTSRRPDLLEYVEYPTFEKLESDYRKFLSEQSKAPRTGQLEIIRHVSQKLFDTEESILAIEAGTGTGKTYGYAIPMMSFLAANPEAKGVISVSTKVLQEQIESDDMPKLQKSFPSVRYCRLKAHSDGIDLSALPLAHESADFGFLCLWNWILWDAKYLSDLHPSLTIGYPGLEKYRYDFSARYLPSDDYNAKYGFKGYFYEQLRSNQLFVVNHSMCVAMNGIVSDRIFTLPTTYQKPDFANFTIFDEAHSMESTLRETLTVDLSKNRLDTIRHFFIPSKRYQSQKTASFGDSLARVDFGMSEIAIQVSPVLRTMGEAPVEFASVHEAYKVFLNENDWSTIFDQSSRDLQVSFEHSKIRRIARDKIAELRMKYELDEQVFHKADFFDGYEDSSYEVFFQHLETFAQTALRKLDASFTPVISAIRTMKEAGQKIGDKMPEEIEHDANTLRSIVTVPLLNCERYAKMGFDLLANYKHPGFFPEFNVVQKKNSEELEDFGFRLIPDNLGDQAAPIFKAQKSVFLSATLFDAKGKRSYVLEELGRFDPVKHFAPVVKSPFDYPKQRKITYYPFESMGSREGRARIADAKSAVIERKVAEYGGRTLVLNTSNRDKDEFARRLHAKFNGQGIMVLKHETGSMASRANRDKVGAMKKDPRTVLVGSKSFSEGVDIAGDNLSVVVITKLPFLPPRPFLERQDSLAKYHSEHPNFVTQFLSGMSFRQAIGRLIRTETDKGEIVILDKRMAEGEAGAYFRDYLPGETVTEAVSP